MTSSLTHNEAVVSAVTAVVQAAVGLEQEEPTGSVVVIGSDARHPETLPLSQQLLLPGEAPVVWAGLRSGVTGGDTQRDNAGRARSRQKTVCSGHGKQTNGKKTLPQ